jgi:hypothetical protein
MKVRNQDVRHQFKGFTDCFVAVRGFFYDFDRRFFR